MNVLYYRNCYVDPKLKQRLAKRCCSNFLQSLYFEPEDTHEKMFIQKNVNSQFGQKWLFVKEKQAVIGYSSGSLVSKSGFKSVQGANSFPPNKLVDMRSMEIDVKKGQ